MVLNKKRNPLRQAIRMTWRMMSKSRSLGPILLSGEESSVGPAQRRHKTNAG